MLNAKKKNLKPEIIYEDNFIFVVNKPAGWVTLKVKTYQGKTLQAWVEKKLQISEFNSKSCPFSQRYGIVHRLDKDTWGLVIGAKDKKSFLDLQAQFKKRQVEKEYLVLVEGLLKTEGKIVAPVGRLSYDRLKYGVTPGGKKAETKFNSISGYEIGQNKYSLIRVWPKTGRTHQIRVHFKYLGHPVYGDSIYGGKTSQEKPMFLVAKKINFNHPESKKRIEFEIDLPKKLTGIIENAQEKKE